MPDSTTPLVSLKVALEPARPTRGASVQVGLRLDNRSGEPLLLLSAKLQGSRGKLLCERVPQCLPAAATETGARLSGRLESAADDPDGTWRWLGEDTLCLLALIEPGASLAVHGPTTADDGLGQRLDATVVLLPVDQQLPLLSAGRVNERQRTDGSHQASVSFDRPADLQAARASQVLALRDRPLSSAIGLFQADYERLLPSGLVVSRSLPVSLPAGQQSLEEARKQAALSGGPAAWLAERECWAVEARGETWLIKPGQVDKVRGRLVQVIDWLGQHDAAEITLFALHAERDPGGLISFLKEREQAVNVIAQRGGWRLTVTVRAGGLMKLVSDLSERGLVVDGHAARRG